MKNYFVGALGVLFGSILWETEALFQGEIGTRTLIQGAFAAIVLVTGCIAQLRRRQQQRR